jgi:hypothetical protein
MEKLSALKPRYPVFCPERLLFEMRFGTWFVETIHCPAGDACIAEREGQRSNVPRQQAEHKTASDNVSITKKGLQKGSHPHRTKHPTTINWIFILRHGWRVCFVPILLKKTLFFLLWHGLQRCRASACLPFTQLGLVSV